MTQNTITYEMLIRYAAGELPAEDAARVEAHIARDSEAAATVTRYRAVLSVARSDDTVAPPAGVLADAKALFKAKPAAASAGLFDALRRWVAELVFDSRPKAALAGIRGAGGPYQLSYHSKLADVDVEIEPAAERTREQVELIGQITVHEGACTRIYVVAEGGAQPAATATPNEHGVFRVSAAAGSYEVCFVIGEDLLVLPKLTL